MKIRPIEFVKRNTLGGEWGVGEDSDGRVMVWYRHDPRAAWSTQSGPFQSRLEGKAIILRQGQSTPCLCKVGNCRIHARPDQQGARS
jgi:hypothetical protein